jgi:uncharacterized protein YegP (UPF0339 family)
MKKAKFKIFRSELNGEWYFGLFSPNGKQILQSEGYSSKSKALKGIESIRKWAPIAEVHEVKIPILGVD